MSENKYYTPIIEEFRVGFEYQELEFIYTDKGWYTAKEQKWLNKVFEATNYMESYYLTERVKRNMWTSSIRVKYLDQTDIEELGFKKCDFEEWEYKEELKLPGYSYKDSIHISKDYDVENLYWIGSTGQTVFDGYIKNKSELSVLLTQLGISNHS
jgi:hypothetical protein